MTTHERELTEEVDLCTEDGDRLRPEARGWSRRPLHRCNLDGRWGENKRWDYWAVLAGDLVVSWVYSDVDRFGLCDVWWADLVTGESGGGMSFVPGPDALDLPEHPGTAPLVLDLDGFLLSIKDSPAGTTTRAYWTERDGRTGRLEITVDQPPDHESVNVVIPWSDERFNFTSKHQARPAHGTLEVGDRSWSIGGRAGDAWGVLDVGRGRWPEEITWNWGGGAGRSGDQVIGLQFGAKWTEGTGFTENGLIIDGRLSKIGRELAWTYDWDQPLQPWTVRDPEGQIDLELTPRYDKHSKVAGKKRGSETHQVFGTWRGTVTDDAGRTYELSDALGFAEEARQNW